MPRSIRKGPFVDHHLQKKVEEVHAKGWQGGADVLPLPIGGFYKARGTTVVDELDIEGNIEIL